MSATELLEAPQSKSVIKDQLNLSSQSLDLFKEGRNSNSSNDKALASALPKEFGNFQINMNDQPKEHAPANERDLSDTKVHKPDGSRVTTNNNGDVTQVYYKNDSSTTFTYDSNHNVISVLENDGKGKKTLYTPGSDPDKPWLVNGQQTDGTNPPSGSAPHVDADGTYHWKGGNGKDYVRTTDGKTSDHDPNPLHRNSKGIIDNIDYPKDIKLSPNGELTGFTVQNQAYSKVNGKWVNSLGQESKDFSAASFNPENGDVNLTLPNLNTQIITPKGESYIGTKEENGNTTIRNLQGQITEIDMPDGHFRQISYKKDGSLNAIDLEDGKKLTIDSNNVAYVDGARVAGANFDEQSRTVTITNIDGSVSTYGPDSHLISTSGTAGSKK